MTNPPYTSFDNSSFGNQGHPKVPNELLINRIIKNPEIVAIISGASRFDRQAILTLPRGRARGWMVSIFGILM